MFRSLLRPGQGFRSFIVIHKTGGKTKTGRPKTSKATEKSEIFGIISQASQREIAQWKQNGHPITHTIVQRGTEGSAKVTDVLEMSGTDRKFLVQAVHNPAELGHFISYKVEERNDL